MMKFDFLEKNPVFRLHFASQVLAEAAAWMDISIVAVLLVYNWHYRNFALSAYTIVLVSGFFSGVP